ncbi:MAG: hypothetical protein Hals2KO_32300 [Halioglobus sp.]
MMATQISTLHVLLSTFIHAPAVRVWDEFTSFQRFAAWFGQGHSLETYEPELGGSVRLSVNVDGANRFFGGTILGFEAACELTFSNNWESSGWPVPTFITLQLTSLYDSTLVELFHHGFDRLGAAAGSELQGYEAGWHSRHLENLKKIVEA